MVDCVITLFPANEVKYNTQGLGNLSDALSCTVTREVNGADELELEYPSNGIHYSDIRLRSIILASPDPYERAQPYRVYSKSEPINGVVTINAAHISYDLIGYLIPPITAPSVASLFTSINDNKSQNCPFFFRTTVDYNNEFSSSVPVPIRQILGGDDGCVQSLYPGEFVFDRFDVSFVPHRGEDRGVRITYGKNLTDFKQEQNISDVYTYVHPYWYGGSEDNKVLVELPEKMIPTVNDPNYERVYPLDASSDIQEQPSVEELREYTKYFIIRSRIGVPHVSIEVSFIPLSQTEEYADYALLERVYLGDRVTIDYPQLQVEAKSECIKTVYDVIRKRYVSIELGDAIATLSGTIVDQGNDLSNSPSKNDIDNAIKDVEGAIDNATDLITGNNGGYVMLKKNVNTGKPEEILILDTESLTTATHVWRWNNEGLGFSSNGYPGPYRTAITSDGRIVADFINAGSMQADVISGGILRSKNGDFEFDLTNGTVKFAELKVLTDFKELIESEGVTKVNTGIGLTIGETSIDIFRQGSKSNLTNSLNENGMYVIKAKGTANEQIMLQADVNGVIATDLKARNYLNIADRIRFEKFDTDSIGCYWIGG